MNYDLWAKSHLPAGQMQPFSLADVFMAAFVAQQQSRGDAAGTTASKAKNIYVLTSSRRSWPTSTLGEPRQPQIPKDSVLLKISSQSKITKYIGKQSTVCEH